MAAFAAGGDGAGAHALAEFHHGDEAVPIVAVPALSPLPRHRTDRGEGAVATFGEWNREAGCCVAISRLDRGIDALEAIELAPWDLPTAEVALEPGDDLVE